MNGTALQAMAGMVGHSKPQYDLSAFSLYMQKIEPGHLDTHPDAAELLSGCGVHVDVVLRPTRAADKRVGVWACGSISETDGKTHVACSVVGLARLPGSESESESACIPYCW